MLHVSHICNVLEKKNVFLQGMQLMFTTITELFVWGLDIVNGKYYLLFSVFSWVTADFYKSHYMAGWCVQMVKSVVFLYLFNLRNVSISQTLCNRNTSRRSLVLSFGREGRKVELGAVLLLCISGNSLRLEHIWDCQLSSRSC